MDQRFKLLFQSRDITLSELARRSQVTPGYLSKIINGKTPNVSLCILVRISEQIDLPVDELFRMIKKKEFLPGELIRILDAEPHPLYFNDVVHMSLNALESNNHQEFRFWSEQLRHLPSPLQIRYENWFEGLQLAYKNLYDQALEKFLLAQQFKACSVTERRLKAKVLLGIASIYLGKGDNKNALILLRKSLMTWDIGVHAGIVYLNMGTLNRRNGAYNSAELCYRSALLTSASFIQLLAYAGLGQLYIDQKKYPEARVTLLRGYCLAKKSSGDRGKGELFCNLAVYYKETGRLKKSITLLKRGLLYTTTPSSMRTRQYLLTELIDSYFASEQSKVKPFLQILLGEGFAEGDVLLVGKSLITVAKDNIRNNCLSYAIPFLQRCYQILAQITPSEELISCCQLLAECFQMLKEPSQSYYFLKEVKRLKKTLA